MCLLQGESIIKGSLVCSSIYHYGYRTMSHAHYSHPSLSRISKNVTTLPLTAVTSISSRKTPESELAVLPASISFQHQSESLLLQCLISDVKGGTLEFKLAPAYSLYMIARHHLSSEYHPDSSRHHSLIHMIKQTCSLIKRVVKVG